MFVYNKEQIRTIEQNTFSRGVTRERLMDNAGISVAKVIDNNFNINAGLITVVCGKGNNGGDGYVVARQLSQLGARVVMILVNGPAVSGSAGEMFTLTEKCDITTIDFRSEPDRCVDAINESVIVVDAIFGIGFHGGFDGAVTEIANAVNDSNAVIVSVDVPSGVYCDNGKTDENAIIADMTVTFIGYKPCFVTYPAAKYCGRIVLPEIGIPADAYFDTDFVITTKDYVRDTLPQRPVDAHKGTFGKELLVCGSYSMAGAAILSAKAAAHSGVGLTRVYTSKDVYPVLAQVLPESVFTVAKSNESVEQALNGVDSCVIGCGLSLDQRAHKLVETLLYVSKVPVVIDADAISIVAENPQLITNANCDIILTPHAGELARLCGVSVDDVNENKMLYANVFAKKYKVTVVEKGAHTIVHAPDGAIYANLTGNPGMATAGSGDMLAGMIGSFIAQGLGAVDAARVAVYIHGVAGDICSKEKTEYFMITSDMIECMAKAFKNILD